MFWPWLVVIARVLGEGDSAVPDVEDHAVLMMKRHNVMVGCGQSGLPDGGMPADASTDAPGDAMPDAPPDAGDDAGVPDDAGLPDAGTCTLIDGDAITMIVQPTLTFGTSQGAQFAMLFVAPSRPIVEIQPYAFSSLDASTAIQTVTKEVEVEDSTLGQQCDDYGCSSPEQSGGGCDLGGGSWTPPGFNDDDDTTDGGVTLEMVGPYQILRVQPTDRAELVAWLDQYSFAYSQADLDAVQPYINRGYHIVAARLAIEQPMFAEVPLAITWAGSEIRIPVSLNAASDPGPLTVYVAAETMYALPFGKLIYSDHNGGMFVTRTEIQVPPVASPDDDPVATAQYPVRYYRETIEKTEYVHVPVKVTCDSGGCCGDCSTSSHRVRFDWLACAGVVAFVIGRRRRR